MIRKNSPTSPIQSGTQGIGAKMLATCAQIPAGTVLQLLTYSAALALACLAFALIQFSPSQNPEPQTPSSQTYTSNEIRGERVFVLTSPRDALAATSALASLPSNAGYQVSGLAHTQPGQNHHTPYVQRPRHFVEFFLAFIVVLALLSLAMGAIAMAVCLVPTSLSLLLHLRSSRSVRNLADATGQHCADHPTTDRTGSYHHQVVLSDPQPLGCGGQRVTSPEYSGAFGKPLWKTMLIQGAKQGLTAGVLCIPLTALLFMLSVPITGSLGSKTAVLTLVSVGVWPAYGMILGVLFAVIAYLFRHKLVGRRTESIHERWAQNLAKNTVSVGFGCALLWFTLLDIGRPGAYGMRLLELTPLPIPVAVKDIGLVHFLVFTTLLGFALVCAYCVAMYGLCGVVAQVLAWSSRSPAYRVGVHLSQQQGVAGFCLGGYTLLSVVFVVCGFYLPSLNNWPDMKVAVVFPGFVLVTVAAAATLAAWAKWFMWEPKPATQTKTYAVALAAGVLGLVPAGVGLAVFLMNAPDLNIPREQWWSTGACWTLTVLGIPSLAGVIAHKTGDWLIRPPHQLGHLG